MNAPALLSALLACACSGEQIPERPSTFGEPETDPVGVALREGGVQVPFGAVYLSSAGPENDTYWLCLVRTDGKFTKQPLRLFVDGAPQRVDGCHPSERDEAGHVCAKLDLDTAERLSRRLAVPIARREERPYVLRAEFRSEREVYAPGDDVRVLLEVTNVGSIPVTRQRGWMRFPNRHALFRFVVHRDGELVRDPDKTRNNGGMSAGQVISPGESFEDATYLNRFSDLSRAGRYRVEAAYVVDLRGTPLPFDNPRHCDWLVTNFEDELTGTFELVLR